MIGAECLDVQVEQTLILIIMLTLEYLMFEVYSKPCQISKMMRHIENLDIVRTVYSGIFMHSSGSFRNIQTY